MPVTPKETIEYASSLSMTDEVSFRTMISRAYYASYYAADGFHESLPEKGVTAVDTRGTHNILHAQLANPGLPKSDDLYFESKSLAYILKDIYSSRILADYNIEVGITKSDAEHAIVKSKKLLEKIEGLRP